MSDFSPFSDIPDLVSQNQIGASERSCGRIGFTAERGEYTGAVRRTQRCDQDP